MLKQENKSKIVEQFKLHDGDTGSVEVQVALLTDRINELNEKHFKTHFKDYASQRGLMKLVGQRRKLLGYLKKKDEPRYKNLIERLGLRR